MRHPHSSWIPVVGAILAGTAIAQTLHTRPAVFFDPPAGDKDTEVRQMVDARIRDVVNDLLDHESYEVARKHLLQEGKLCTPHLIQALKDPRFHRGRKSGYVWQLPLSDVMDTLVKIDPQAAARELPALLDSPKGAVRRNAAYYLGYAATDDCGKPVATALKGKDHEVQVHAARGVARAAAADRMSPAFGAAVFDPLVTVLAAEEEVADEIPDCLVKIDPKRAAGVLVDDKFLDPSGCLLVHVLEALAEGEAKVPAEKIARLLEQVRPLADRYPGYREYGLGLRILAQNRYPGTQRLIDDVMMWGDKELRTLAMRARCVWEGIPDPDSLVFKMEQKQGSLSLSDPQKKVLYVLKLENHVESDGFEDYFGCTCGRNAATTLSGLQEMGALRTARLLQKAMDQFGTKGPSRNTDTRNEQLSAMNDEQLEELDSLSNDFAEDLDERRILVLRYAIRHKEHFCATPSGTTRPSATNPASKPVGSACSG